MSGRLTVFRSGVGKYINMDASKQWVFCVYLHKSIQLT
jgi:hypothetical protein